MNKLFEKTLTVCTIAFAMFGAFACSDKIAGTAEEPNQSANRPNPFDTEGISSSSKITVPEDAISSSSKYREDGLPTTAAPTSSESLAGGIGHSGNGTSDSTDGGTVIGILDSYLISNSITDVTFDANVLAYNKTFESCDTTKNPCIESPDIAEFRTIGLHKITPEAMEILPQIFPKAYQAIKDSTLKTNGCPLYILNINDTSPAIHVLTKISNDSITINNIHDNCDYEPRPFDMHVGFLFSYCGELSESPEIINTTRQNDSMKCGSVSYNEVINTKNTKILVGKPN